MHAQAPHTHTHLSLTFTILFTFEDDDGGGISGLGSISSSGTRSGLSEKMLSRSICVNKNMGVIEQMILK